MAVSSNPPLSPKDVSSQSSFPDENNSHDVFFTGLARGAVKAATFGLKKGVVKRKAFVSLVRQTAPESTSSSSSSFSSSQQDLSTPSKSTNPKQTVFGSKITAKIAGIVGGFGANVILGMAVFGTYENVVNHLKNNTNKKETKIQETLNDNHWDSLSFHYDHSTKAFGAAPLTSHIIAGFSAGGVYSTLALTLQTMAGHWERLLRSESTRTKVTSVFPPSSLLLQSSRPPMPTFAYCTGYIMRNSLSFSALFGGFEFFRRSLDQLSSPLFVNDINHINNINDNDNDTVIQSHHFAIIGLAGGFAGQLQHLVKHYTLQLLPMPSWNMRPILSSSASTLAPLTLQSTLAAFPPSALVFLVFQCGETLSHKLQNACSFYAATL